MISFVLMEPQVSGNVGATARAMKNFGFSRLVIINPKCDAKGKEAMDRAKHARGVLTKAVIAAPDILSSFHTVIATTSALGTDYNIPRSPVTPEQLLSMLPPKALAEHGGPNIAILLGREGIGLTNKEILQADFTVTIPSAKAYPALNVSHAAAIMAYELSKKTRTAKVHAHITPASAQERTILMCLLEGVLQQTDFTLENERETQRRVWKRLFARSFLSRREAFAAMGLLRKLGRKKDVRTGSLKRQA